MNWLKRKIRRWLDSEQDIILDDRYATVSPMRKNSAVNASLTEEGLRFNVLSAQGGTIIELRKYDQKTDRNLNSVHVIPEGEDVAKQIGLIVSMELLRTR
jgi:hypothetical protein